MSFDSFGDFLQMGGHGFYVWLSYGMGLLIFLVTLISPVREKKRLLRLLSQQIRRQDLQQSERRRERNRTTDENSNAKPSNDALNNEAPQ